MQQLNYQSVWNELLKAQKSLYKLRKRPEFTFESLKNHWDLRNQEECLKALNSLLYLLNREKQVRKKEKFKREIRIFREKDWLFYENVPYNEPSKTPQF